MGILHFGSKAENLVELGRHLEHAKVNPLVVCSVSEWFDSKELMLDQIQNELGSQKLIVRSSVSTEDSKEQSNAGAFLSVAGVTRTDRDALSKAIEQVIAHYPVSLNDEHFFVQEQLISVSMSGVMLTRDLDTLAPYFVINYDVESGVTDSVTSGRDTNLKTYLRFRDATSPACCETFAKLIAAARELEAIFDCDHLDIEFAFDLNNQLYILQVRPIVTFGKERLITDENFGHHLLRIHKKIKKLNGPHPGLHGNNAAYSVMSDWNPAEIVGTRPRTLALSLYKELITDSMWAYQRMNYGYRDLRSFPLLISFIGLPYVDVRASFNSFIPASLDEDLSSKLVDYYIRSLASTPSDHDKIEFNIVFSCYYFGLPSKLEDLKRHGFSDLELDRLKYALLTLTNGVISPKSGIYLKDLEKLEILEKRFEEVCASELPLLDKIYWLIEDCKRFGTLPFAGLARAGFIAVQFLRSFVETGIFTENDYHLYMNSLNTVAKSLSVDTTSVRAGNLSKEDFLSRYGHLRPGTYDLLSPRYDQAWEKYFFGMEVSEGQPSMHEHSFQTCFELSSHQLKEIDKALTNNGLQVRATELMQFLKQAIEGREYGKFIFTRSLSHVLTLIDELGEKCSIDKDDLSHLNIRTLMDLYSNLTPFDLPYILATDIHRNKAAYKVTQCVRLPQVILHEDQVYEHHLDNVEPNFVTLDRVTQIVVLEEDLPQGDFSGRIVLIKSADPGYDWIFSRRIAGLVTMYGGANSHMAIRCAEQKIPAVIGCGEKMFESWSKARQLDIDCANKKVRPIY